MSSPYRCSRTECGPWLVGVCHTDTIYDVLRARGWKEVESETDWDVAWVETAWLRENFDGQHLEDHQRINHFRNHYVREPRSHDTGSVRGLPVSTARR